jgi:hypothetical protein
MCSRSTNVKLWTRMARAQDEIRDDQAVLRVLRLPREFYYHETSIQIK